MRIAHGQLWTVTLDPTVAKEQSGVRPCLVVSTDRFNELPIGQALVVPLTTRDRGFPHHVRVIDDGGLRKPSWAMCEALRAVSIRRFGQLVGLAAPGTVAAVSKQVIAWLDQS